MSVLLNNVVNFFLICATTKTTLIIQI